MLNHLRPLAEPTEYVFACYRWQKPVQEKFLCILRAPIPKKCQKPVQVMDMPSLSVDGYQQHQWYTYPMLRSAYIIVK